MYMLPIVGLLDPHSLGVGVISDIFCLVFTGMGQPSFIVGLCFPDCLSCCRCRIFGACTPLAYRETHM